VVAGEDAFDFPATNFRIIGLEARVDQCLLQAFDRPVQEFTNIRVSELAKGDFYGVLKIGIEHPRHRQFGPVPIAIKPLEFLLLNDLTPPLFVRDVRLNLSTPYILEIHINARYSLQWELDDARGPTAQTLDQRVIEARGHLSGCINGPSGAHCSVVQKLIH